MANGYFERGEIYGVRMDSGFGSEQGYYRPAVILSNNHGNETNSVVNVAFTTTKCKPIGINVEVMATGRPSWVLCNQIATVDKARFGTMMGVLNSQEQRAVDDALEKVFDLGYIDETAIKEKESEIAGLNLLVSEAKAETATVKAELGKRDEEIAALKMEIEMWQKCYGRCMDMLVNTKVNSDLSRRVAPAVPKIAEPKPVEPKVGLAAHMVPDLTPDPPKQPEPPVEQSEEQSEEPERLDVNSCTATALKKIGFSLAMARKIVESRPFKSVEDLKRVNGLKSSQFRIMAPKLCCVPVKEEEQPEVTVVEPVVEQERDPGFEKVNINTAKAMDLHTICGFSQTAAYSVTGYRKKNGPFQCVDDLLKVSNVSKKAVARCRDMLEV